MKINNNISAVITNNQLLRNENSLTDVMERLSSGFKINHAKDDPSGMAISSKMKAQIDGLDQASTNASNGQSVLETADGALQEVTSMIQRMRELAVQAANDTNAQTEKDAIQLEIANLKSEIDRVSSTTEFNTKTLLDGSLDARVYGNNVTRIQASDAVAEGFYEFHIDKAATQAKMELNPTVGTYIALSEALKARKAADNDCSGEVQVNGSVAHIEAGMTGDEIYEALRNAAEIGEARITGESEWPPVYTSMAYGSDAYLNITASNPDLAGLLGIPVDAADTSVVGTEAEITIRRAGEVDGSGDPINTQFDSQTTYKMNGNKVTFTSFGGFEMSMKLDAGVENQDVKIEVTNIGPMTLQIGANEGQTMEVRIPSTSVDFLYLDELDISTVNGAERAIGTLDDALNQISLVRASLGAYENRLDHTINSLDETSENMNAAISRIQDADMATEMVEYTKLNVLEQAATSALSQANELPQMTLQLLQ